MTATFKSFEEMTPDDYADIGLRCGLETHQQLLTRTKLFCRCPAGRYSDAFDAEILRHMRPTLSELGEYDGTALMEKKTRKNIYYRIHHDTVCTYEFDDTPPFFMADDALDYALEVALLLRLNMVNELHIARKQYLDGSIPTGFQRTTIVGVDGWIPFKDRKIRIRQLGLEEDACREVSDVRHDRVYLTDRLGMPLIEPVTEPDMRTPEEVAEVGEIIRRLCRSTGKVRTGYGAARQDVNVSVRGGTRIEIKGVPQLWRIPRLVYNEARRQCSLLAIRSRLKDRGVIPDTFEHRMDDVTRIVTKTQYAPMRAALEEGHRVMCVVLKGFGGILNEPTQEHTTFAREFSDRVRVIACLTPLPNIVHSDTASESLYGKDWQRLRHKMKANPDDALILVWGDEADVRCAADEIVIRAKEATVGVPSDTRQGLKDGTNGFERVLPGANRMYPDTDLPPLAISAERLARIASNLPEYVWDREKRYRSMGLGEEVVATLSLSRRADLFLRVVDELKCAPAFAAIVLCERLKAFRRRGLDPERVSDDEVFEIFKAHAAGRLTRAGVLEVLGRLLAKLAEPGADHPTLDGLLA
ncbi:MAG: Glu-tRNA(Gln) amidotransferase subunit GatE, partial [bacterium]|nr:Glu-tRNA(Gln) amidotransferase subunit GatE [bacterium]